MKYILPVLFFVLCYTPELFAQGDKPSITGLKAVYNHSRYRQVELGVFRQKVLTYSSGERMEIFGPFLTGGLAIDPRGENVFAAPRVGCEYHLLGFGVRASVLHLTDFSRYTTYLTPEIGISLAGKMSVVYGFNFRILQSTARMPVNRHQFSVHFNFY